MDMQAKKNSAEGARRRGEAARTLRSDPAVLAQWCVLAGIEEWGISRERFTDEWVRAGSKEVGMSRDGFTGDLARWAEARFRGRQASAEDLHAYVGALRLKD